ncbi:MAG: FG-GAP repeat protein, partial [Pirellulales bacterium]|nr:FG-GAP repeat protein [Pirellulales bacterium]
YTVVLTMQPTANVTIALTPNGQVSVDKTTLTFTSSNWNVAQTVTVSAVNDQLVEGNHTGAIAHQVSSSDPNYNGLSAAGVTAQIADNDAAGVQIAQSGGSTNVAEGGATDSYTVVLTAQPTANVTITLTPNGQVSVDKTTLTFTSSNWNVAQTVTVSAVNDQVVEGNHTGAIVHQVSSSDPNYNGLSAAGATAQITDNDFNGEGISVFNGDGKSDFNGDGTSDVLWLNRSTGAIGAGIVKNAAGQSWASIGQVDPAVWKPIGVGDFNGDKTSDILWQNQGTGGVGAWIVKNGVYTSWAYFDAVDPAIWKLSGAGDFNGDGTADILWQNQSTGGVGAWIVKNGVYTSWAYFDKADPAVWKLSGVGDFNGDGTADVLWHNQSTGGAGAWIVRKGAYKNWAYFDKADPAVWKLSGVGDFNGDKTADVLWRNQSNGGVGAWIVRNGVYKSWAYFDAADAEVWNSAGVGDVNGDGTADLLWHNKSSGSLGAWIVKNGAYNSWAYLGGMDPALWHPAACNETASYLKAESSTVSSANRAPTLTPSDLQPIVREAIVRWSNAGLNAAALARLPQIEFVVSDLPDSVLGKAEANRIYLDRDAAGHGWFIDPTPARDEEFVSSGGNGQLRAVDSRAVDRIDLLSVVEHELGHALGLDDLDASLDALMSARMGTGIRRLPVGLVW